MTINFEQGKVTALVGPSGSGKSTIVQLIERFYDPSEGSILIDSQNLKDVNLKDFRSKVGYVGQEPVLFNQTIRENLRYGNPEATDDQMVTALQNANAMKIIDKLPKGLDTIVGAQGGQLSGGEKQRIALARAFIKDPKILILDEATSALDRHNENEVQKAIDNLKNGGLNITTIVIAHRLSTIRYSDKIIVLKEGKVVEEGDHKSLLKDKNGIYSKLVSTQKKLDDNQQENTLVQDDEDSDDTGGKYINEKIRDFRTSESIKFMTRKGTSFNEEIKTNKEKADKMDEEVKRMKEDFLTAIKKKGYFKRLIQYNKPYWLIVVGLI